MNLQDQQQFFIRNLGKLPSGPHGGLPDFTPDSYPPYAQACLIVGFGNGSVLRDVLQNTEMDVFQLCAPSESSIISDTIAKREVIPDGTMKRVRVLTFVSCEDDLRIPLASYCGPRYRIPRLAGMHIISNHPAFIVKKRRDEMLEWWHSQVGSFTLEPGNSVADSLIGVKNLIQNAPKLMAAPCLCEKMGLLGDAPVVCVGSGPSLETQINALRAIQSKAYIFAANSAVKALIGEGIAPDVTFPVERTPVTIRFAEYCRDTGVWFAGSPVIPRKALDCFGDRVIHTHAAGFYSEWMDPLGAFDRISMGWSTGAASIACANYLTKGPIFLVGHDLCYDNDKSHYAAVEAYAEKGKEHRIIEVPGNCGKNVKSQYIWSHIITQIATENRMRIIRGLPSIINTGIESKTGALIAHCARGSLKDLNMSSTLQKVDWSKRPTYPGYAKRWIANASWLEMDMRGVKEHMERVVEFAYLTDPIDMSDVPGILLSLGVTNGSSYHSVDLIRYLAAAEIFSASLGLCHDLRDCRCEEDALYTGLLHTGFIANDMARYMMACWVDLKDDLAEAIKELKEML